MRAAITFTLGLLYLLCGLLILAAPASAQTAQTAQATPEATPRRVALVVGNNNYATAPLSNPVNDARAMAMALQGAGFTVILRTDATQRELNAAVREFGERLKDAGSGAAGLFYFAGHGMQIKGRNFLIPVGANIEHEDEVSYQALDAQAVMDKMESAGNGTNIVILDACRNNPFTRSFRSSRQGLAQMDAPVGSVVAFSTAPGSVANDGNGSNGLYTAHLLRSMQQPGQKVEDVFKQVRSAVLRETAGRQVPWEATSLIGDFYFHLPAGGAPVAEMARVDSQAAIDDALWSAVKDSTSSAELFAYLNRFPEGRNARAARSRMANLVSPPVPTGEGGPSRFLAEVQRWGEVGTDKRPAEPRRNAQGLAEGDRYRWRVTDKSGLLSEGFQFWRLERFDAEGRIAVNGGEHLLDAQGQVVETRGTGNTPWRLWRLPLPLVHLVNQPDTELLNVQGRYETRLPNGVTGEGLISGSVRAAPVETLRTAAGSFQVKRLDVDMSGSEQRSDGRVVPVRMSYKLWYARELALPVAYEAYELVDRLLERNQRHELTAVDALSLQDREPTGARARW